jgi:hypothetical protein
MAVKRFIVQAPVANVIKPFMAVSYEFSLQATMLIPCKPFQGSMASVVAELLAIL